MKDYIKLGLFGFVAVCGVVYMFVHGPKPSTELKNARTEKLEDREFYQNLKTQSLKRLRSCYDSAETNYDAYWERACKSTFNKSMEECLSKVPEDVCRSKFKLETNCELPGFKAEAARTFREEVKKECVMLFKLEVYPIESANGI